MIRGSIVALVTPMHDNGDIDWEALDKLLDLHVESGTAAIGSVGTTGEAATLDYDEHLDVIKHTVDYLNGRIPVIAGTGANSTREAIDLTCRANDVGADAALLVTPYYNKPTQEGMYRHFMALADAVEIPQVLYNVPGRTGCDMKPETVLRLVGHDNIVGIKEATGDLERAKFLIDNVPADFAVYSGDDGTAHELMLMGGQGNISVTANVIPVQMAKLCELALAGKAEETRALQESLNVVHHAMFTESNPIPVKWALHEMGLIKSGIRLPLTPLAEQYRESLREALKQCQVI